MKAEPKWFSFFLLALCGVVLPFHTTLLGTMAIRHSMIRMHLYMNVFLKKNEY